MGQEPRSLHAAIERPLNLAGRNTLLTRHNELDRLQPQVQREMAILEYAADPHRERLAAGVTLSQARTASFSRQAADSLVFAIAAMGADRTVGPQMGFDIRKSGFFIVKMRGGQNWLGHRKSPMAARL
jgi:hypothetical protein